MRQFLRDFCLSVHPACGGRPHCILYSRGLASIFENIGALVMFNLRNVFVFAVSAFPANDSSCFESELCPNRRIDASGTIYSMIGVMDGPEPKM